MNAGSAMETQGNSKSILLMVVGIVAVLAALFFGSGDFVRAYHFAFVWGTQLAYGSLFLWLIHNLTGGAWGARIKGDLYSASKLFFLMALLFIPVVLGADQIFPWLDEELVHKHHALHARHAYLNLPFFAIRGFAFLIIGGLIPVFVQSRKDPGSRKLFSGLGLVFLGFGSLFVSTDWFTSLEIDWFNSMSGFLWVGMCLLFAVAFHILHNYFCRRTLFTPDTKALHDIGKLLFAFTMAWAYLGIMQYIIVWSGNLPEEVVYYLNRGTGRWGVMARVLAVLGFFVPFLILLPAWAKVKPRTLIPVCVLTIIIRALDVYWHVLPSYPPAKQGNVIQHLLIGVGVFALAVGAFLFMSRTTPAEESVTVSNRGAH